MNLIGSIIRSLGINIGNSPGSTSQGVRDSSGVVQAGRDVNVYQSTPEKTEEGYPPIGAAYFPHCDLALKVYDLRFGIDRGNERYMASFATERVAKFAARLNEADYAKFDIVDMAGWAQIECHIAVPEGQFVGTVTYIEIAERGSDYMGLMCWFTEP